MDLFTTVKRKVEEYEREHQGASIEKLLDFSDWFAIYGFYIAEVLGEKKTDYNTFYFLRKSTISLKKQTLINDMSAAKATTIADAEGVPALRNEINSQGESYTLEIIHRQMAVIVKTIQQRISHLKNEKGYKSNQA